MQSTHVYWASTLFQTLVCSRGLRQGAHRPCPVVLTAWQGSWSHERTFTRQCGQCVRGRSTEERPWPGRGEKEGFLGDVSLEEIRE